MQKVQAITSETFTIIGTALFILSAGAIKSTNAESYKLTAVPFTDVTIEDEFWSPRIETNRKVTIPYVFNKLEETGRIDNFVKAAGKMQGEHKGQYWDDSEVYKAIEGAAYSLRLKPDLELEKYIDGVIDKIVAAQQKDGYLHTYCILKEPNGRWKDIQNKHELYCAGHFFEAAVAYYQATGKRKILDAAIKLADHIDSTFGLGKRNDVPGCQEVEIGLVKLQGVNNVDKKREVPGHEEIEIGLVKMRNAASDDKYLKLSKFFLDERGCAHGRKLYGPHYQDHKPVVEQDEAVGHVIRAVYMYCAMADVAAITGDQGYTKALDRIWENFVSKKLYITGGIGAKNNEAFGDDYEMPNETAYNETCGAISGAMWNHRLFLLHGDAKYIDVLERMIYNELLAGVSLSGDKFFYVNPLASDGKLKFNVGQAATRSPWLGTICCITNISRFMPSLGNYAYATCGDNVYVNLFIKGSVTVKLKDRTVHLKQQTRYPWDGSVRTIVEPESPAEFAICIRIPGWARNQPVTSDLYRYVNGETGKVVLSVNDESVPLEMEKGFARIRRTWKKGDVIELNLPMSIRRVQCHEKVKDNIGRVAIERGPLVYCFEEADNPQGVANLVLPKDNELHSEFRSGILGGIVLIKGQGKIQKYQVEVKKSLEDIEVVAIPYYVWSNRGVGEMSVWLAQYAGAAEVEKE